MSALQTLLDALALGALYAMVAMGLSLVFGVMRLVNFAQGELITVGAYSLVVTYDWPTAPRILVMVATVVVFALATEVALRPLRGASPATLLVTTFAFSFLLQSIFLLVFSAQGDKIGLLPQLNRAVTIGDLTVRWVTFAAIGGGALLLSATALFLNRTTVGLQMRAAAHDIRTARTLGVRANRVIMLAFLIAGLLAAAATLLLAVRVPLATPTYGFVFTITALVGVVVGGMDRLVAGTLGGFLMGMATSVLADVLPGDGRKFLTSVVFGLVIVVLLLRPNGLLARRRTSVERV